MLTLASYVPAAGASAPCNGGGVEECVELVKDYATHCGTIPLWNTALCWFAEAGLWYDFAVNGVVVDLVGCQVIGGPACISPVCQPVTPSWPRYCSPTYALLA